MKSLQKNNKGSHVGVILSFVIFITFSLFIYVLLEPSISVFQDKSALLEYLRIEIKNEMSEDLTTAVVDITNDPGDNCIYLSGFLNKMEMDPPRTITKDNNQVEQNSYQHQNVNSDDLAIERTEIPLPTYFKIYHSNEFPEDDTIVSCTEIPESDYNMGQIKTENFIFKSKVEGFKDSYTSDYETLKTSLNVAGNDNFGFTFELEDGSKIEPVENIPVSSEVYSQEIPAIYVDDNANIKSGYITIRVW